MSPSREGDLIRGHYCITFVDYFVVLTPAFVTERKNMGVIFQQYLHWGCNGQHTFLK